MKTHKPRTWCISMYLLEDGKSHNVINVQDLIRLSMVDFFPKINGCPWTFIRNLRVISLRKELSNLINIVTITTYCTKFQAPINKVGPILYDVSIACALEQLHLWHMKFGHPKLAKFLQKSKQKNLNLQVNFV